jgi:hypothetical protein
MRIILSGMIEADSKSLFQNFSHESPDALTEIDDLNLIQSQILYFPTFDSSFAEILRQHTNIHMVLLFNSPACTLASAAIEFTERPIAESLQNWITSSELLLSLWRQNRARVHLLNLEECTKNPVNFSTWLQQLAGCDSPFPKSLSQPDSSPLYQIFYEMTSWMVESDSRLQVLWNEMVSASQPISDDESLGSNPRNSIETFGKLAQLLHEFETFRLQTSTKWEQAKIEVVNLRAELASHKEAARKTQETLLLELQEAFKESEGFCAQLEEERHLRENTCKVLEEEKLGFSSALKESQKEVENLRSELASLQEAARKTQETLLLEIHEAFRESEGFFEQWKSLEASAPQTYLTAGAIQRGLIKNEPPHCQVDYIFENVVLFERRWSRLEVRLVEHHGRAGLAIFLPRDNQPPLHHWKPTGQEPGRDFMLLVPNDRPSKEHLVGAPASDLLLVRGAITHILGHLALHGGNGVSGWILAARRLLQELDELPERVHYDSVKTSCTQENGSLTLEFDLVKSLFQGQCVSNFLFAWKPSKGGGSLIFPPETADHPLLGSLAPTFANPSARGLIVGFASKEEVLKTRSAWTCLTKKDRNFILFLAKALPDFIFHVCEQYPDQKIQKDILTGQAKKIFQDIFKL